MRVLCRHGHFAFYPRNSSDIAKFSDYFDVTLERERDYFTFEGLIGAEEYSLPGKAYLNLVATKAYAGKPWEVMRENNFVYNISLGMITLKSMVMNTIDLQMVGSYFRSGGSLLQPGSRNAGMQVMSYSAEFVTEGYSLNVLEFDYE